MGATPSRQAREGRETRRETMILLVISALVAAVSAEADPQYYINPYYTPYQPVVQYYPQAVAYPQYQQVAPSSYAEPKEDKASEIKPTLYNAEPEPFIGIWDQIPKGSGKYLPGVFGWDRGEDYFMKWNTVPVQLRNNRVRWRTDGQMMRNGFNSASGADPNKYTDKKSYPGSYQGRRKKREAEPQQYIVNPYTYSFPQYQPVAPQYQPVVQPIQAVEKSYAPTTYSAKAEPFIGIWDQLPKGSGKYLPGVFGWDRGEDYFMKWNTVPVQLRNNRVRWRTDGQMMRNGFNSASGADPNKYTDKKSYPGSYQG